MDERIVEEFVKGRANFQQLADEHGIDVLAVYGKVIEGDIPDGFSLAKDGNCKIFPLERQRLLIFQILKAWFMEETLSRYLDTKMILAKALTVRDALKLTSLPVSEGTIRGFLDNYNIRLSEQTILPGRSAGKFELEHSVIRWYKEESQKRVISSQMIMDKAMEVVEEKSLNYTVTKSLLSTLSKKHGIKLSEQPRLTNYSEVKDQVAEWYREESKVNLISHQKIVDKAKEFAKDLGVDRQFNKYWAANFCKSYGFEFNDQQMAQRAKELRAQLLEWYKERSTDEVVSYQSLMENAKEINDVLEANVDITKGWVSSFVKINDIRLSEQDSLKNIPKIYDRLNDWYEIESQFREIGAKEIQERVLFLADKFELARDRIHDHFVAGWQRKFNINLLQSPAKLNRIKERDNFDLEITDWFNSEKVKRMVSTSELKVYGERLVSDGKYQESLVKDKFWHEQLFKRRGISIASQPHYTRKTPNKRKAAAMLGDDPMSEYEIIKMEKIDDEEIEINDTSKLKIEKLFEHEAAFPVERTETPTAGTNPVWMDIVFNWYTQESKKRVLVRSDVHNMGVQLNIGTEISKSWVKNWCRKYKVNFLDQEIFKDIALIEQKALDWYLNGVGDDRPTTLTETDGLTLEDVLRKGAEEREISNDFITKKYLERLIKRKDITKPKAFMQKKFGTMSPEHSPDDIPSFTNFLDDESIINILSLHGSDTDTGIIKQEQKEEKSSEDVVCQPMSIDEVNFMEWFTKENESRNLTSEEIITKMRELAGVELERDFLTNLLNTSGLENLPKL